MTPETGARFSLELVEQAPSVNYRLEVELPGRRPSGSCRIDLVTGQVVLEVSEALPTWLENTISRLLRSLWRSRSGPGPSEAWPRRLTRWRQGESEAEP